MAMSSFASSSSSSLELVCLLLLSVSCLCIANNNEQVQIELNDDVLGLIVFKSDLVDPFSYLSSWNEDADSPCSWKFVECNNNGRVSGLFLDGLSLSGKLGKGLEKLQDLKVLSLSRNVFNLSLQDNMPRIDKLERLNFSYNALSGPLVSGLVRMSSNIRFLDLSVNSLSGSLPDDVFQQGCSLRYLSLSGNSLQGSLPSTLAACSSLNTLDLSNNQFSGDPDFGSRIWSLSRIRSLDLSHNLLTGSLPRGVSVLHNLKVLQLQGNKFSGPLPMDIGLCPHLNKLDLSSNLFDGSLPETLQSLSSLAYFDASSNRFIGEFPQWLGNLTSLEYLDLSSNELIGSLPISIGNLKSIKYLSLSNNKLTGSIPLSIVYCTMLSVFKLRGNLFNGGIPEGLFGLTLDELNLSSNKLVGTIPTGSTKFFGSLRALDLSNNNLTGKIPDEMGLSTSLRYLNLSWNTNLQSRIPPEIGYFQNLTVLDLRNSGLSGSIPADICDSGSLTILQLDGNSLSGSIPEELGNCSSLYLLSLSHNNLNGSIPRSISTLKKLKFLKLEFNELSGEIPQELGELENLLAVNISYNRLIGRLPVEGIFPSLDQSAMQGNLGICSPLLKGPCKMNVPKPLVLDPYAYGNGRQTGNRKPRDIEPDAAERFHRHMFLSVSAIIAISAAVFIVIGVVIISLLNVSARKRLAFIDNALESMCSSSSRSGSMTTGKLILFDLKSSSPDRISNPEALLNKAATIGEGTFGTVYQVPLGSQGRTVAIKRLVTSAIIQYPEEFDQEVRVLAKAKHPNLIQLKGYYWTPQLQLLVSEYAPNGSLQTKLHERLPSTPPLSWATRFRIIDGVAKGLAHLHHSFRPPIIHYNIKPSNILLDENDNPKITDFGLIRLLTKLDRHVMSNRFQSALGYMAPEVSCQNLRVNEKCDTYGFGVLILEVVTGRRPVEYGEDNVMILNDQVRYLFEQGNVMECVDPSLNGEFPDDEVLPVLKLALVCTSQIPSSRPSMGEVVQILQVIKTPVPQRTEIV